MPTFEFTSPQGQTYSIDGPEGATQAQAFAILQQHLGGQAAPAKPAATGNPVIDFIKSVPGGVVNGLSSALSAGGQAAQAEMGQPIDVPGAAETSQILQSNVTGQLPQPQGMAGRFGQSVGEYLGNPASYIGPGGAALKVGGAILGGLGSQAGEEIGGTPGRIAGSVAGGLLAGRVLGPRAAKAEVPSSEDLLNTARQQYRDSAQSGLELSPQGLAKFATAARQDLSNGPERTFTGGTFGTAPQTFRALDALENLPSGSTVTVGNLNAIRDYLGDIAGSVRPTTKPGVFEPTADAAAAMALRDRFNQYLANIPQNHVVAGDPAAFKALTQQATGNWGAGKRALAVESRIKDANDVTDRQIAGSLESQIKSKIGGLLKSSESRGMTPDEIALVQLVNSGNPVSNFLRQAGRLSPRLGTQGVLAAATGGASIPAQLATLPFYGARLASGQITNNRASDLVSMLAKRSPLYQQRVSALPAVNTTMPLSAQALRSALLGLR